MKNNDNLKTFFDSSNLLFCTASAEGYFTEVNDSWVKTLGWTKEELLAKPFIEFVHPDDIEKTTQEASQLVDSSYESVNFINRYITKNGGYKTLSWNAKIIDNQFICVVQDITTQVKQQEDLTKTSEVANIGSWELDLREGTMTWCKETYKIHGYVDHFPKLNLEDGINFYHPKFRPMVEELVAEAVKDGTGWNFEAQIITVDGKKRWIHAIGVIEKNAKNEPIRFYGTFQDIDDKKKSMDLFDEKKNLLDIALSNSKMGIWNFNPSSKSLMFDDFWCKTTGLHWCSDPIEWDVVEDRLLGESKESFRTQIKNLISKKINKISLEIKVKGTSDNKYILLEGSFKGSPGDRKFVGIYQDITEKKVLEKTLEKKQLQMVHASKMNTLGEMAGGVAHEINNPLAILSQVFSSQEKEGLSESLKKKANLGKKSVERISNIIKSLKEFSSENSGDIKKESLSEIVERSLRLHQTKIKNNNIDLKINIPKELEVICSSNELVQAIFNLIQNSIYAVKESPIKKIVFSAEKIQDSVLLKISDSGPGVDSSIQSKIFEPFFTTKDYGDGSGLGLSSSKGLVENFGGSIRLSDSSSSEFIIELKA